jgi:outer membrane protein OmpA-like peptidoglycan-associated protein
MKTKNQTVLAVAAVACSAIATAAHATPRSPILDAGSVGAIRGEVEQRYNAAVAASVAPDVVGSSDTRYIWASEAKVACGIAIGFLKTNTVDEESINKCDDFSRRMTMVPPPPPPPPVPVVEAPPPQCTVAMPIVVYFEWNVDTPPADADAVITQTAQSMSACGWHSLSLAGHADRSGSDRYNQALSQRRANNVAAKLAAAGVGSDAISIKAYGESSPAVQTPDGVREPLNRRVEITAQ